MHLDFAARLDRLFTARPASRAARRGHSLETLEARIAPAALVTSIVRAGAAAAETSAGSVDFTVTFSEAVSGVGATDFLVHSEGNAHANAVVTVAAVSSTVYTVTVNGLHGQGDVRLDLLDDDSITGASGPLGGAGLNNGSFQGAAYHLLQTFPKVLSMAAVGSTTTNSSSVSWTLTLSAPVTGVDTTDFTLVKSGVSADAEVTVTGSGTTYTVMATHVSGTGTLGLKLVDDGTIKDANGNPLQGSTPPAFAEAASPTAGNRPRAVVVADVNGDGKPDLVTVNGNDNTVSVMLGNGNGGFAAKTDFITGTGPRSASASDVNGDGLADLVIANYSDSTVSVLLGNGSGGFAMKADFATGSSPASVAVGDVNGDGRPDIVTANNGSNTVSVLLGNGSGGFAVKADFTTGTQPETVAVADLNGDGKPDLVVANFGSDTVSVLLGNGSGGFATKTDFATGKFPGPVAVVDVSGDGKPDLVIANTYVSGTVSVLLGNGSGGFAAKMDFATGKFPSSVAVTDVNGDGKPDLVTANQNGSASTVSVLLGDGSGAFAAKTDFATGTNSVFVATGDVNGDGKPDLVTANFLPSGTVSVLLGASLGTFTGDTFTIQPPTVSLAISPAPVAESSVTGLVYTFTRTGGDTSQPLTINFTKTGSAAFTTDYTATSSGTLDYPNGTLTIPAGAASVTVTLTPVDDRLVEGSEDVTLTAVAGSGYSVSGSPATGAITDNDTATITFGGFASSLTEGNSQGMQTSLAISASGTGPIMLDRTVTVSFTSSGTATGGGVDFTHSNSTITYAPGAVDHQAGISSIITVDDRLVEGTESADFTLGSLVDGTGGQVTLSGTLTRTLNISDNDTATVALSAPGTIAAEGGGLSAALLTLTLNTSGSGPAKLANPITVNLTDLATGSATAGGDYTFNGPTAVTFAANSISGAPQTASFASIVNDQRVEGTENVNLSAAIGSGPGTLAGSNLLTAIIIDNDTAVVRLSGGSISIPESLSIGIGVSFAITANGTGTVGLDRAVTVVIQNPASGTATQGADYTFINTTATFPVGTVNNTLALASLIPIDDRLVEGTETVDFTLGNLSDGTGGQVTIGTPNTRTLQITDNDTATIGLSAVGTTAVEGGGRPAALLTLMLNTSGTGTVALGQAVTVNLTDLHTGTALAGSDYTFTGPTALTFAANSSSGAQQTASFASIIDDQLVEGSETVNLSAAIAGGPATLAGSNLLTASLLDNDTATLQFVASTSTVGEAAGTQNVGVQLVITANGVAGAGTLGKAVSVHVQDLLTGTATDGGADYSLTSPTTLTFAAGSAGATQNATLSLNDDARVEGTETVKLALNTLADATGQVTLGNKLAHAVSITDDDTATITLSGGVAYAEGQNGTTAYTFTATLDHAVQGGFSAAYATNDGTATVADGDYADNDGALSFAGTAGETLTITVLVSGDRKFENDETFSVALGAVSGAPTGLSVDRVPQTGTITNDDGNPAISIPDMSVAEGHFGTTNASFTVSLSNASFLPVTVEYATANGTAMAPGDYTAIPHGTLTFAPGETSKTISVGIRPDTLFEAGADETFFVNLSLPMNATLGADDVQAVGTILSDDGVPAHTITLDARHPFTFFDHNHDKVTVKLTGLGTGTLILDGGVLDGADISEIHLDGNVAKSTLSIVVAKDRINGDGRVEVGEIIVDGALAGFSGPAVDITVGGLRATGVVKTLTAHSFAGELFTGGAASDKLALTFGGALGVAGDTFLISTLETISALKAGSVSPGEIHAAALASVTASAGAFAADITSLGAIGPITVKGGGLSGDLVASSFGTVSITGGGLGGSLTSTATATTLGKTKALTSLSITGGNLSGAVQLLGASGAITVKTGSASGDLTAASFGAVAVTGGSFSGTLTSTATAATLGTTKALTSLSVTSGNLTGDVNLPGASGAITVKTGGLSGHLTAASFGAVSVTGGDFGGSLTSLIPAETLGRVKALTSLTVSDGNLTGDIRLRGASGAITVKSKPALLSAGSVTGASIVASAIASLTVGRDFISSIVLAGADLGADHAFGGGDDTFAAGTIGAVKIGRNASGAGSIIGAGFSTTDTHLKDANDAIIGGVASIIASLTVTGTAAPETYFAAGFFKAAPKIAGVAVTPASDARFKVG